MPTARRGAWETEIPEGHDRLAGEVAPGEVTVIVTDAITGRRTPRTSNSSLIA